mmetsp:Transcript_12507/g.34860  ORF Transcript_12507/g.34860 Transcript_12507/m.34860 type:complete len:228 (+) Transcript_12507:204-887(+)
MRLCHVSAPFRKVHCHPHPWSGPNVLVPVQLGFDFLALVQVLHGWRPIVLEQVFLDFETEQQGRDHVGEHALESVSFRVHLVASELGQCVPHDLVMGLLQQEVGVRVLLAELCGRLDVGENEDAVFAVVGVERVGVREADGSFLGTKLAGLCSGALEVGVHGVVQLPQPPFLLCFRILSLDVPCDKESNDSCCQQTAQSHPHTDTNDDLTIHNSRVWHRHYCRGPDL